MLFDLFGSDSDFIEEYENILAEKLLLSRVQDINEEIKNIELLKLRFGESKMIRSTVMLRDIDDSHRFNTNFKEDLRASKKFSGHLGLTPLNSNLLFVSSGYWPINTGVTHFEYPEGFLQIYNEIHEQFKKHKHIMILEHHNNLGSVQLELKFNNGAKHTFRCEPIQAIIVSFFDKKQNPSGNPISLDTLAKKAKAQQNYIKSKLYYWLKKGVIVEDKKGGPSSFPANQTSSMNFSQTTFIRMDTIQEDSIMYRLVEDYSPNETAEEEVAEEIENELFSRDKISSRDMIYNLKKYEPKITAILSLNGPKKIQKMKCLLETVYKPEGHNLISLNELTEILNELVKRRKITVQNEVYSLCSSLKFNSSS